MTTKNKIGWSAVAFAIAVFFTTQFLAAQIVGPPVFTPQMTVSPGFLTVTTGPTTVQDLTINGTCTGCVGAANFQNPTGTIGLTAVNGVAATGIRSDGAPALSQAIVPTWTGIHTFNAIPNFNGGTSGASAPFTADSTFLVTNLNADLLDGISSGSFATLAGSQTFTGENIFSNAGVPLSVQSTDLAFQMVDTDAVADEKIYWLRNSSGVFNLQTRTDAAGAGENAFIIDRTGTTVDSINLQATAVQANGSNICTANGTNCPLTETSGQFQTLETTGCSNSHSLLFAYRKIGTEVFLQIKAGGDCTSDGAGFVQYANTNWPAALLPLTTLRMAIPFGTCNATVLQFVFQIGTTGSPLVDFRPTCATASTLQIGSNLSMVITYSTAFPSAPG